MKPGAFQEEERDLAEKIVRIGFSCTRCGDCCREGGGDDNLVMVSPAEIRAIAAFSGLPEGDIAEPYPESVNLPGDRIVTFGRVLRRVRGRCPFLSGSSCTVYPARPAICRTYPFMLDGSVLRVFPCRGLGRPISGKEALEIAGDLIRRRAQEEEEARRIRSTFGDLPSEPGRFVVDAEGVCRQ